MTPLRRFALTTGWVAGVLSVTIYLVLALVPLCLWLIFSDQLRADLGASGRTRCMFVAALVVMSLWTLHVFSLCVSKVQWWTPVLVATINLASLAVVLLVALEPPAELPSVASSPFGPCTFGANRSVDRCRSGTTGMFLAFPPKLPCPEGTSTVFSSLNEVDLAAASSLLDQAMAQIPVLITAATGITLSSECQAKFAEVREC